MFMFTIVVTVFLTLLLQTECLYSGEDCSVDDNSGVCIPLRKCQYIVEEIRKSGNPMPMQMRMKLQRLTCGFQVREPMVCCLSSYTTNHVTNPVDPVTRGTLVDRNGPVSVDNHPNLGLLPLQCGNIESDRIYGGNRTRLYEMPWMVLLSYDSGREVKLSCGGSLINEWYVLTAAHCVEFLSGRMRLDGVILGEHDVRQDPDCEISDGTQYCAPKIRNVSIASVLAHPGYNPMKSYVNDIALIRLAEPADFSLNNMKPLCLPFTRELQNENLTGHNAVVAGWGVTEDGLQSPVLLSVDLPVISQEDCTTAYRGSPQILDSQLCAGGIKGKDSCGGDSGGPLMYPGKLGRYGVRYVLRGLVSYGLKRCGQGGYPGVYTNVAYYMKWILDNMHS